IDGYAAGNANVRAGGRCRQLHRRGDASGDLDGAGFAPGFRPGKPVAGTLATPHHATPGTDRGRRTLPRTMPADPCPARTGPAGSLRRTPEATRAPARAFHYWAGYPVARHPGKPLQPAVSRGATRTHV